ncbi:MAG: hypothetical protein A4E33_01492 [Methanoregula sp. PtaB.Bin085]|nr:MAG: hypothetical protein A4E33_01492 [Methanoregula sp. PtaB.Bin085]
MIDTWLLSALVTGILALLAMVRGVRAVLPDDRLVTGTVAVILVSLCALTLAIAWSMFVILDGMILVALLAFGAMIWYAKQPEAGSS